MSRCAACLDCTALIKICAVDAQVSGASMVTARFHGQAQLIVTQETFAYLQGPQEGPGKKWICVWRAVQGPSGLCFSLALWVTSISVHSCLTWSSIAPRTTRKAMAVCNHPGQVDSVVGFYACRAHLYRPSLVFSPFQSRSQRKASSTILATSTGW